MSWDQERRDLLDTMQRLDALGMVSGSSGNASVKLGGDDPAVEDGEEQLYLVTPAGIAYGRLGTGDMVVVNHDLEPVGSDGIPSSESLLHIATYDARPDVSAIIHTHSVYASVQAVKAEPIPPIIDEMVVYIGGQIEVSEYGFVGSDELAKYSVKALGDRRAAIIRNHGMFAVGPDLPEAFRVAELVERVAKIYVHAKMSGTVVRLPESAIATERGMYLMRAGLREDQTG
ncbi:MAG: class II aldolase/adducin family protein [Dehalococcoidia bacterium]|jgi:L-fuculose-phosphate aldolase|nr:class II aldolase/adducin family protein [Dehalococcoidia bacterium]